MSILEKAVDEERARYDAAREKSETTIDGQPVDLDDSQTTQTVDDTFLTGASKYGVPLGAERHEARELGQTWAMEIIKNAIFDQVAGGERAYEPAGEADTLSTEAAMFRDLVDDVLAGPHLMRLDWSDLLSTAISDMADVGMGYWEPISAPSIPVAAFKPVDGLSVRHNVTRKGEYDDPPFYQAPFQTHGGGTVSLQNADPEPLQFEDLIMMRYPGSARSDDVYPRAPGLQVKRTLELLFHSTTHHIRYYNDNEIPEGFLQVMQAGDGAIKKVKKELRAAAGDPRKASVIGGDGPAKWISMGDSAINLNVIEEQKWFLQLCLAAFGAGKAEIGLIEDVNRANGEVEQSRVFKRIAQPFIETFEAAINRQVLTQFDVYNDLGRPFEFRMRLTDPEEERRREQQLRERYTAGALTYAEYRAALDEDVDDTVVEIDGTEVDYGAHPRFVVEQLIRDARGGNEAAAGGDGDDDGGDEDDPPFDET